MLSFTNEVMYKQLRDWMIYGNLNDKYEEFFICHDKELTSEVENQAYKDESDLTEIDEIFSNLRFSSSYSQFKLNSSKLPSFINLKIANKILFTGELLQIFQIKCLTGNISSINGNDAQTMAPNKLQYLPEFDRCNFIFF